MAQRSLTLMLLAPHELSSIKSAAESLARISREQRDDAGVARALELVADVDNERRCRAAEADDAPF